MSAFKNRNKEAMTIERLWKIVVGGLALVAVSVALGLAPLAALAQNAGGPTNADGTPVFVPAYQVGSGQGDGQAFNH